jgi:phospholipase/carboxylesterase
MKKVTLGGLQARLTGGNDREGGGDGPLVVLLHGFGAPGEDLVPLWRVLSAPEGTRFLFPEAPLSLEAAGYGAGRAWWMIDMQELEHAAATGEPRDTTVAPPGLEEARARVIELLDEAQATLHAGGARTIVGGFSQGAMLSLDVALRTKRPLAGLVLLSTTVIAEKEWLPLMPGRRGLSVLQSHGQADPLLPYATAERLRDELVKSGLDVRWISFRGGHEIPGATLDELGRFLQNKLG